MIVGAVVIGVLCATGAYLILQRTLTRTVIGLVVLGHGANLLLLLAGGPPGQAPNVETPVDAQRYSDPLPQAFVLTAIVITFSVSAFLLVLAYRSRMLTGDDEMPSRVGASADTPGAAEAGE